MGESYQADIPGNRFRAEMHVASVASNGAAARYVVLRAPASIKVTGAYWTVYGANQTADTTSYRRVSVVNGGTAGQATTIIASLNLSASKASMSLNALSGTATMSVGEAIVFSHVTVGGNKNDETELQAGMIQVEYQLL